jgi:hypothetical protein
MNIACRIRRAVDPAAGVPHAMADCLFVPKPRRTRLQNDGEPETGEPEKKKLEIGVRDHRFWHVAGCALDLLDALGGSVSDVGKNLGISTGNVASFFKSERHLLTAANEIRKRHALTPLR